MKREGLVISRVKIIREIDEMLGHMLLYGIKGDVIQKGNSFSEIIIILGNDALRRKYI